MSLHPRLRYAASVGSRLKQKEGYGRHTHPPRRGSVGTVKLYLKALAWFVEWSGLSPDELVKLSRERVEQLVQRFCDMYAERGRRAAASNYLKALKSFLKANGFDELELEDYEFMRRFTG